MSAFNPCAPIFGLSCSTTKGTLVCFSSGQYLPPHAPPPTFPMLVTTWKDECTNWNHLHSLPCTKKQLRTLPTKHGVGCSEKFSTCQGWGGQLPHLLIHVSASLRYKAGMVGSQLLTLKGICVGWAMSLSPPYLAKLLCFPHFSSHSVPLFCFVLSWAVPVQNILFCPITFSKAREEGELNFCVPNAVSYVKNGFPSLPFICGLSSTCEQGSGHRSEAEQMLWMRNKSLAASPDTESNFSLRPWITAATQRR